MTHKISYALFAVLLLSSSSYAAMDYACQSNCINKGYMLQYCQQVCSYDTNPQSAGGIDYSHGMAGAYNSLQQQAFENQQAAAQNQQLLQQRQLEIERMQLENEKLRQEVRKNSTPAPASDYKSVADSSIKSPMPENADPDQYAIQGWSCKTGFTQVGKSCINE